MLFFSINSYYYYYAIQQINVNNDVLGGKQTLTTNTYIRDFHYNSANVFKIPILKSKITNLNIKKKQGDFILQYNRIHEKILLYSNMNYKMQMTNDPILHTHNKILTNI